MEEEQEDEDIFQQATDYVAAHTHLISQADLLELYG